MQAGEDSAIKVREWSSRKHVAAIQEAAVPRSCSGRKARDHQLAIPIRKGTMMWRVRMAGWGR